MNAGKSKITAIELFRFDEVLSEQRSHERNGFCGLLLIAAADGSCGYLEFELPCRCLRGDLVQWAAVFQRIKGLTLTEGMAYIRLQQQVWGIDRTQLIETVLLKLNRCERWKGCDRAYLFDHSQAYVSF
ncbi:hypothetical protein [Paenibacillus silvisoli]|uniref:hypothetical protein n=1 Tax=Paenibacillus silvisoli TaxID=3110539 RepID=UPI002803D2A7|nr:hypothetical protein [Paenibacillus silvisoli]